MQNIGPITLKPNFPLPFNIRGNVLQILSSGNSAGLTVQFLQGGQVQYTVEDVLTGWKIKPAGGFDSLTIESATGDTISAIVTGGDIDIQFLETTTTVANTTLNPVPVAVESGTINMTATNVGINNTSANPVPVSLVSEPGAPIAVSLVSEPGAPVAVTVGNTSLATTVQQAASITDAAPVAIPAYTGGSPNQVHVRAAGAARALRFCNPASSTGMLYLGGPAVTPTNAVLALNPGDVWEETLAAALDWYATSDTGATANMQVIA
jgi:hypothetical protein